jgi:hypothetical protein
MNGRSPTNAYSYKKQDEKACLDTTNKPSDFASLNRTQH